MESTRCVPRVRATSTDQRAMTQTLGGEVSVEARRDHLAEE
jgi:hypothetical protein